MSVLAEVPPRRSQVVRRRSCPDKAGRTCNLRQTTSATRRSHTPTRGPGIERERRRNGQGAEGRSGGGFAAYRREGFTAATKRADKARRVTGAGRGKARDVSRRRSHPTTAAPPRWTRPFRRDSGAAPRQGAKTCAAIGFRLAGKRGAASESMPGEARANRTGLVSVRLAIRASPGAIITRCSERPMAAHVLAATPPLLPSPRPFHKT